MFCLCFSPSMWLIFHTLKSIFCRSEVFNFNTVKFFIFSFIKKFAFGIVSKTYHQIQGYTDFSSVFFFKKFYSFPLSIYIYDPLYVNFLHMAVQLFLYYVLKFFIDYQHATYFKLNYCYFVSTNYLLKCNLRTTITC